MRFAALALFQEAGWQMSGESAEFLFEIGLNRYRGTSLEEVKQLVRCLNSNIKL